MLRKVKAKETATLCPLDWLSNYSLLRLWHTNGSLHQTEARLREQLSHSHMLLSGQSILIGLHSGSCFNNPLGVLVAQLVGRHSCVADRLPVVVRFPAGPRVSLKSGDQPKGRWRRPKKKSLVSTTRCLRCRTCIANTPARRERHFPDRRVRKRAPQADLDEHQVAIRNLYRHALTRRDRILSPLDSPMNGSPPSNQTSITTWSTSQEVWHDLTATY